MNFDSLFDPQLAVLVRGSRYAARRLDVSPLLRAELAASGTAPFTASGMTDALNGRANTANGETSETTDETTLHQRLRHLRERVMLRLIFRDLNGLADLNEVVTTISHLADETLRAAVAWHHHAVAEEFGLSQAAREHENAQLLIVGMGKLGSHELNVSSDIDLIFVHAADGVATDTRSWHEFHVALGKRIIRAIDEVNEHGYVFRVDMRLRPFGASGPLVTSLDGLANYFQTQARPWERYAWLKGRAITGHPATISALEQLVKPFVYRPYLDFGAMEEMRDLHAQIRAEATKRNRLTDIKVGEGGIREVEFVAQMPQLIRGGREARLRTRSTRDALREISALGLMPTDRVNALLDSYTFLRNLEHRLQYVDDAQTQALPTSEPEQARIAETMGFDDWAAFSAVLAAHRQRVTREFDSLFSGVTIDTPLAVAPQENAPPPKGGPHRGPRPAPNSPIGAEFEGAPEDNNDLSLIEERIQAWHKAARTQSLVPKLRNRIAVLIPAIQSAANKQTNPKVTFFRLFDLLDAIDKRETYLALLMEYPNVVERLARIASRSAWAAEFVRRHPMILDELIYAYSPTNPTPLADWAELTHRLEGQRQESAGDIERQYELLRQTKQSVLFRVNVADIEGRLSVMTLSDSLSALADFLLNLTVRWAWKQLFPDVPFAGFAVVAYGKLGSKELGYASDLDIVFVYDAIKNPEHAERWPKLAQRINSWLNTMTAGGVLYETDLRLRPDGASGLLVSSLDAFRDYQLTRAWTWEHQALTRARWCAGDAALIAPFEVIRAEVLTQVRDRAKLKAEIIEMRERMRAEKKDRADALDLKNTRGGIVDIEFIVQYLILAYSHEHKEFLGNLGNFALLTRAGALGILAEDDAAHLGKAYLAYRAQLNEAQNQNDRKAWIGVDELREERLAVSRVWNGVFGG
jgi:[glutamine synthetase] adenylyltransferase / [glutamine synthetase]-adenylyl-L-tyrosine phosphorylase